jgi:multiple sugar transport system permease protein
VIQSRRASPAYLLRRSASYAMLILASVVVGMPIFFFLLTSLKSNTEYLSYPVRILPRVLRWDNYYLALTMFPFFRYARNSLFLAIANTVLVALTSSMAGFGFARLDVPGRDKLFAIVVALLIVPGIVTQIPQFIVFSRLHLTNTYWPWILWGLGGSPFFIFLFRQFFATFPTELEDAGAIDGCGHYRLYAQIFLPNAKPVLATAFILNFSGVWGEYINPLIYLSDAKTTLAVKLAGAYVNPHGDTLTMVTLAACVMYTLPLVVLFFIGQKYIMKGVITSGLAGR